MVWLPSPMGRSRFSQLGRLGDRDGIVRWWIRLFGALWYLLKFLSKHGGWYVVMYLWIPHQNPVVIKVAYCFSTEESINHVFLLGLVAARVWKYFARKFGFRELIWTSVVGMIMSWFHSSSSPKVDHFQSVLPLVICWNLWRMQNQSRFQGATCSTQTVILLVEDCLAQLGRTGVFKYSHFKGYRDFEWARFVT